MAPAPARTVRERKPRERGRLHDRRPSASHRSGTAAARSSACPFPVAPGPRAPSAARCASPARAAGSPRAARPSRGRSPSASRSASDPRRARPGRGTGSACRRTASRAHAAPPRRGSAPAAPGRRRAAGRAGSSGSRTRSARSASAPNALPTSRSSRSIVAIVIVSQWSQPPVDGVSKRRSGYGLCAYASSRACAAPMPRMKSTGETPRYAPRGAVTPPATFAPGVARWMAA